MKNNMLDKSIIYGMIIIFVGASVVPGISGTNIRSIEYEERVYAFEDMNYFENSLSKGVVFEDDFDAGNTPGQDPVGWSVTELINSEVAITGATYVSSPHSVELYNPSDSGINIRHGFTSLQKGTVECHVRSSANGCFISTNEQVLDDWGMLVTFWNGKIMYLDPSGFQDLDPPFTYTPDTWYHFRLEFDCGTDTYDIYINNNLKKQDASMKNPSTFFSNIWISCEYTYACTAYLDNVIISEANAPPNTPNTPSGPITLGIGESGTYTTSATDPDGDQVQYRFDWDDGIISDWTDFVNSGTSASISNSWDTASTYVVKAQSRDEHGATGAWSSGLTVTVTSPNQNPNTPSNPSGPTARNVDQSGSYSTSTTDPDGDQVQYRFDWDDGIISDWTDFVNSGTSASISNSWDTASTYVVKAQSRDEHGATSAWSSGLTVVVNDPPTAPDIDGKTNGKTGVAYDYNLTATDPDGHDVKYFIDWGDGDTEWTNFSASGATVVVSHTWAEKDTYTITAKAQDKFGLEGPEGTLEVSMPKNKAISTPFLQFLENHPHMFPRLRQLLGL